MTDFNITDQEINSVAPDADGEITIVGEPGGDPAIFAQASVRQGSGTGNYNTILAVHGNDDTAEGFQTDATSTNTSLDDVDLAKTETTLLANMPIYTDPITGEQYIEYRLDLNEPNNQTEPLISLTEFKLYSSTDGAIEDKTTLESQTLLYDMDALEDNTVYMEDTSSGSGTDDYVILIPIDYFDYSDPENTYIYLYVNMGEEDPLEETGGFEEYNQQTAGSITGVKFEDVDQDGVYDDDENPIENIKVYIDENNNGSLDAGERFDITDVNGEFAFYGMPTSDEDYIIREVVATFPDSNMEATNEDGITGGGVDDPYYWLAQVEETGDNYFLEIGNFTPTIDIKGIKYEDDDGDGTQDGGEDAPAQAFTIKLYTFTDTNDNDVLDAGEVGSLSEIDSTATAGDGSWSFDGLSLLSGLTKFYVQEVGETGWTQTDGTDGYVIDPDDVGGGNDSTGNDFGNFEDIKIEGIKYEDDDGDGVQDAGEDQPAEQFTINLYTWDDANGNDAGLVDAGELTEIDSTMSSLVDGSWEFEDLGLLDDGLMYYVQEEVADGWTQTDGLNGYVIDPTAVGSGETSSSNDFGNFEDIKIEGIKYEDDDGDGFQDAGEDHPAEQFTINLYTWDDANGNDDGIVDAGELTEIDSTLTSLADGSWEFEDLALLDDGLMYYVQEEVETGWTQTDGLDGYIIDPTAAGSGETSSNNDFGSFELYDISGTKYADANGDGETTGDSGMEGVRIFIDWNGNGTWDEGEKFDFIDANGEWEITNLDASYDGKQVIEDVPDGFTVTLGAAGYTIDGTSGNDQTGLDFANHMMEGANRTPGFWQSNLGKTFYDGVADNQGDVGGSDGDDKDFAAEGWSAEDLLLKYDADSDGKFLIWDLDGDGEFDDGDDVALTFEELCEWVSGSDKKGGRDFLETLQRDVAAAYLNTLNNDSISGGDGTSSLLAMMDDSIEDSYADAIIFYQDWGGGGSKKQMRGDWKDYGSDAHIELAAFNENGEAVVEGELVQILFDGDDYSNTITQSYLSAVDGFEFV